MLGGWALTGGRPDTPPRQAPAPGSAAQDASGAPERAGTQSQQAGAGTQPREQQDGVREDTRVRDVAPRAQQRSSLSGAAGPAPARRRAGPQAPSPSHDAAERRRADEAARLAARLRAERRAQDQLARRREAAARAEMAEQAADRARDTAGGGGGDDEPEAD